MRALILMLAGCTAPTAKMSREDDSDEPGPKPKSAT